VTGGRPELPEELPEVLRGQLIDLVIASSHTVVD
jgi:hypothetical protein